MCTVTYLPGAPGEFTLTSNRDEDVLRSAALPVKEYELNGQAVYYPQDPRAQGTWIANSQNGFTLCLLNGAFFPHKQRSEYKKSRGLVLLDFYNFNDAEKFSIEYDFTGIEPFTLVIVQIINSTIKLFELRWDEEKAKLKTYDSSLPHIWSSVTLYTKEVIAERESWFSEFLINNENYSSDDILFFHHFGGVGRADKDLIINRGSKKTVSICLVNSTSTGTEIIYEDIVNQKLYKSKVIKSK